MSRSASLHVIAAAILIGIAAAVAPHLVSRGASRSETPIKMAPGVGMPGGPPTSASGLQQRIAEMESRLQRQPDDLGGMKQYYWLTSVSPNTR